MPDRDITAMLALRDARIRYAGAALGRLGVAQQPNGPPWDAESLLTAIHAVAEQREADPAFLARLDRYEAGLAAYQTSDMNDLDADGPAFPSVRACGLTVPVAFLVMLHSTVAFSLFRQMENDAFMVHLVTMVSGYWLTALMDAAETGVQDA